MTLPKLSSSLALFATLTLSSAVACQSSDEVHTGQIAIPPAHLDSGAMSVIPTTPATNPKLADRDVAPTKNDGPRLVEPGAKQRVPDSPPLTEDNPWSTAHVPVGARGKLASINPRVTDRGEKYEISVGKGSEKFTWVIDPKDGGYLSGIGIEEDGAEITPMFGATMMSGAATAKLTGQSVAKGIITLKFSDGVTTTITPIGRSLRIDLVAKGGPLRGHVEFGMGGVLTNGRARSLDVLRVPYFDIATAAAITLDRQRMRYLSTWFDPGMSNASTIISQLPGEIGRSGETRIGQTVSYFNGTGRKHRPMRERVWVTWGTELEEALPSMDRPVSAARETADDRFYVAMTNTPFDKAKGDIEALAGMGLEGLQFFIHHWQRDGYDTGYPNDVMPPREEWGGAEGLLAMRETATALGFGMALHHNWIFNTVEIEGASMVGSDGRATTSPEGGHYLKPRVALELVDEVEGEIQAAFGTNGTYTDSLTAALPEVDMDSSEADWGLIGPVLEIHRKVLESIRAIHGGPIAGEGGLGFGHVLWAGFADVLPGSLTIKSNPPARAFNGHLVQILPQFALGRLHEISLRAGVGQPTRFSHPERWTMAKTYTSEERDLMQTFTALFGNVGYHWWFAKTVPGTVARNWWGMRDTALALGRPDRGAPTIEYVDQKDRAYSLSEWLAKGNSVEPQTVRIQLTWDNGEQLFCNLTTTPWTPKELGKGAEPIAVNGFFFKGEGVEAGILMREDRSVEVVTAPERLFLDGRGENIEQGGLATNGAVGAKPIDGGWHIFPIFEYVLDIPSKGRPRLVKTDLVELKAELFGGELPTAVTLQWIDNTGNLLKEGKRELGGADSLQLEESEFNRAGAASVRVIAE